MNFSEQNPTGTSKERGFGRIFLFSESAPGRFTRPDTASDPTQDSAKSATSASRNANPLKVCQVAGPSFIFPKADPSSAMQKEAPSKLLTATKRKGRDYCFRDSAPQAAIQKSGQAIRPPFNLFAGTSLLQMKKDGFANMGYYEAYFFKSFFVAATAVSARPLSHHPPGDFRIRFLKKKHISQNTGKAHANS